MIDVSWPQRLTHDHSRPCSPLEHHMRFSLHVTVDMTDQQIRDYAEAQGLNPDDAGAVLNDVRGFLLRYIEHSAAGEHWNTRISEDPGHEPKGSVRPHTATG